MTTLLIISVSLVTLTACSTSKPHCDAYGKADIQMVDTLWALPSTEVNCTLATEDNNNQPQPEVPTSANEFAYIREDKELTGTRREA